MKRFILPALFAAALTAGCTASKLPDSGSIVFLLGTGTIHHGAEKIPAAKNAKLYAGDRLEMNRDGTAVVSFNGLVDAEVQPGAVFTVAKLGEAKGFILEKGNLWFRVNRKLSKNELITLKRPQTTAAVRGTKFYAYETGDLQCTCECEGKIDISGASGKESFVQEYDTITVTRDGKTAVFSPDDLRALFGTAVNHDHSSIDGSPLGKKSASISDAKQRLFMQIAEKKLKNAR